MKLTNAWVNYIDRTYASIKASVLNRLTTTVPELTDHSSSNLLIIIVDMFSGVYELLNYYIDITARELFLPTARRFTSVLKLANLASYVGRGRVAAYAAIEMTAKVGTTPTPMPEDLIFLQGHLFADEGGRVWQLVNDTTFRKGFKTATMEVRQYTRIVDEALGTSDGSINQRFVLPVKYSHDSLDVKVGVDQWNRVDVLSFSFPSSQDFYVAMQEDGQVYLIFGDNVRGSVPTSGEAITISYGETTGVEGNVAENTITTITSSSIAPAPIDTFTITNPYRGYGGKAVENIEDLRKAIPMSLRTLYRAVSFQDYIDMAVLAPGVRGATIEMDCGIGVSIYIIPEGGGNPTQAFLAEVQSYFVPKAIIGLPVAFLPSGETRIKGTMNIQGRYRVKGETVSDAVNTALTKLYDPYLVQTEQSVRSSDIIATVDSLPQVDYLTMPTFYAEPYLRPSNLQVSLDYIINTLPGSTTELSWKLIYDAVNTQFHLYKNHNLVQTCEVATLYSINNLLDIYITSIPSGIVNLDYWEFKTYPYNVDIELTDHSIPIILSGDFTLNITENWG